jgi:hypothetical protein
MGWFSGLPDTPKCFETCSPLVREFTIFAAFGTIIQMTEDTEQEAHTRHKGNGQKPIEVTPLQLLGIILKCVLKDRITDEEIQTICSVYYKTIKEWWG